MKASWSAAFLAMMGLALLVAQERGARPEREPVCVAVRVTSHRQFVGTLRRSDFEVLEDGVPQDIAALYLCRKSAVERREGEMDFRPVLSRRFLLVFQISEFHPKFLEAFPYLIETILAPGDSLEIQTAMKSYTLSAAAWEAKARRAVADEMAALVRRDTVQGNRLYDSLLKDLKKFIRRISAANQMATDETDSDVAEIGLEAMLAQYRMTLQRLDEIRAIDPHKLTAFARAAGARTGRTHILFVHQREFRPTITSSTMNQLMSLYQDQPNVLGDVQELFQFYHRETLSNRKVLREAFADSGACLHFIYMNREPERAPGIVMREQSEDIFQAFSEIAQATGGAADSSQDPAVSIKQALDESEGYYLLFYTPASGAGPSPFRTIQVRIRGGNYDVSHRAGYLSR
jgi:hypothetical protein